MPRIRTIKPEFWTDEKIISLPYIARLFFIGLWNFADDFGAIEDKPNQLRLLILPNEETDIDQMLDLLIAADLVDRYVDFEQDKTFLIISNWLLHQKVDHPSKSKIITETSKKLCIPAQVRRNVAAKYKCNPGQHKDVECYFCGIEGRIFWAKTMKGRPSGWVSFSLELSHLVAEAQGGPNHEDNIILACRNCNRSMGIKNAFEWLMDAKYSSNHRSTVIEQFRDGVSILSNTLEHSRSVELERKGKEGNRKGKEGEADEPPRAQEKKFSKPTKEELTNYFEQSLNLDFFSAQGQAAKFFDYYESNGWKIGGKSAMKDWQATARTWKHRMSEFKNNANGTPNTGTHSNTRSTNVSDYVEKARARHNALAGGKQNT